MKPRRDQTASPKFIDNIGKEEATVASIYSLSDKGDMTLVAAAKNENRQAFEVLVERHARRIFFAARRMTRTREDGEDVVQQSLQQAFVHLHQFEGKSSFSTWLTRISINEVLILLRKGRGLPEVMVNDSTEGEEALRGRKLTFSAGKQWKEETNDHARDSSNPGRRRPRSGRGRAHTPITREKGTDPTWGRQEAPSVGAQKQKERS
jgi:RNA polymerase sigma factor (sigma-70 family)